MTAIGLIFDIIGALMLACGELVNIAAHIREAADELRPLKFNLRWYEQFPVWIGMWIAIKFCPKDCSDVEEDQSTLKGFSISFWALSLVVVGFLLQLIGSFQR
jgi:hypothetical protein